MIFYGIYYIADLEGKLVLAYIRQ